MEKTINNVREVLDALGYKAKSSGNFWLCPALYRGGDNPGALSINKETGGFVDFVSGAKGSWNQFLNLALNGNKQEIEKYTSNNFLPSEDGPKFNYLSLMQIKKYDKSGLEKLVPLYDFYLKKGISKETLLTFQAGLATNGKMNRRIVFPIFDWQENLIGFAGRTVVPATEKNPKWIFHGPKKHFAYPLHLTRRAIEESREAILVESIGDALALYQAGIKNVACLLGLTLGPEMFKRLIALNPRKIWLSLNNDENKKQNAGQEAVEKLRAVFSRYFDNVEPLLPPAGYNDWGDCSTKQIQEYFNVK